MNNQKLLRNALGSFATGVCVVIARSQSGELVGMTINSFSSVSLDPSLVLWSLKRDSHSYSLFSNAENFVFNVLSFDQKDVAARYAKFGDHQLLDEDIAYDGDTPVIKGAISFFECSYWDHKVAGDHDLIFGQIIKFGSKDECNPLTFFEGKFRGIETLEALEV
jgi:flavin reductase (DIM6/NTAB) family NADH-FMN oxidoreductase RutF